MGHRRSWALDLRYAVSDAEKIEQDLTLRLERSSQFEQVAGIRILSDIVHPDGASKEAIRNALARLRTVVGLNDPPPQTLFFFAGKVAETILAVVRLQIGAD